MTFPLMPFGFPGFPPLQNFVVCSTYVGAPNASGANSYDISRSAADPGRFFILAIASGTVGSPHNLNSATVDGVAATVINLGGLSHFIIAPYPTGSFPVVVANWSNYPSAAIVTAYTVNNLLSPVPVSSGYATALHSTAFNVNLSDGAILLTTCWSDSTSVAGAPTWGSPLIPSASYPTLSGVGGAAAGMAYLKDATAGVYNVQAGCSGTLRTGAIVLR